VLQISLYFKLQFEIVIDMNIYRDNICMVQR